MSKLVFLSVILFAVVCLEPERDNPYDPNNPNKAYLAGTVYNHNWGVLPDATIKLKIDHDIRYTTTSDLEGKYEFSEVDPGIYILIAEAEYYSSVWIDSLRLYAGCYKDTFDIYFRELYFNFENELLGTDAPFGFNKITGNWQIQEDNTQPGEHSTPNVYNGLHDGASGDSALAVFRDDLGNFTFRTKLKILSQSVMWHGGIVLRYQDMNNFYVAQFSANALTLVKIENGIPTTMMTIDTLTFATDRWYHLCGHCYDSYIKICLNYEELFEVEDTSAPFSNGKAGLWVKTSDPTSSATANFDDVTIRHDE